MIRTTIPVTMAVKDWSNAICYGGGGYKREGGRTDTDQNDEDSHTTHEFIGRQSPDAPIDGRFNTRSDALECESHTTHKIFAPLRQLQGVRTRNGEECSSLAYSTEEWNHSGRPDNEVENVRVSPNLTPDERDI
jgi:hypothetical protein